MDFTKYKLPVEVKRVIDWDGLVVDIDHLLNIYSKNVRIRMAWIDAPSMKTIAWKQAKTVLQNKLEWQEVSLSFMKIKNRQWEKESKKDKYGRYLATVWIDDRNINQEMIDEWFATIYN